MRTYYKFKNSFKYESYLDFNKDFKKRRSITKLRISSHRLEVEIGRYQTKNITRTKYENRLCKMCDLSDIEDEYHVLLVCPKYSKQRDVMMDKICDINCDFKDYKNEDMFKLLMQCNDFEIFEALTKMLDFIINVRGCI